MTRCLTKDLFPRSNNHAFSLLEMLMAVAFSVLLLTGVYGFYDMASQSYNAGISGQTLQDGSNTVINKINEGETESGTVYRLPTAVSYLIANGAANALYTCGGAPQAAACNASYPFSELYYCQDNPCTYNDATARWYYLNSSSTSVIYHHPAVGGGTVEEKIYTAPPKTTLSLRFSSATNTPANVVRIDVAMITILSAGVTNTRMATSGAATIFILLRNHP